LYAEDRVQLTCAGYRELTAAITEVATGDAGDDSSGSVLSNYKATARVNGHNASAGPGHCTKIQRQAT
jgi:hypothetical protein